MRKWIGWTVAALALNAFAPATAMAQALIKADHVVGPRLVTMPALQYPDQARQAGVEGQVEVEVVVDSAGHPDPRTLKVVRSTAAWLNQAATDAVKNSRYEPGRVGDKAVPMPIRVPIAFRLQRWE